MPRGPGSPGLRGHGPRWRRMTWARQPSRYFCVKLPALILQKLPSSTHDRSDTHLTPSECVHAQRTSFLPMTWSHRPSARFKSADVNLRHTFTFALVRKDRDVYLVQWLFGYRDGRMTQRDAHLAVRIEGGAAGVIVRPIRLVSPA